MAASFWSALTDRVSDVVSRRPGAVLIGSHLVSAAVFLYVLSEGRPVEYIKRKLFRVALSVASASGVVDAEMAKMKKSIEHSVIGSTLDGETLVTELPERGWSAEDVSATLRRYGERDSVVWKKGKVSGAVYHGGADLTELVVEAFRNFALGNPLHPDVFPSLRKMESEVVAMTLKLFNAGPGGAGTMTSGGTESILMAIKTYRDVGRARGIREPELVVPTSAHAAFDKACNYFGVKLVHVPVNPTTFKADVAAMARAVNSNTIGLVGSAVSFAQGVIDPIQDLAAVALKHRIPLHVDCCLGSFLIAFAEAAGRKLPLFDFRVPGVTSISTDTHKFGFAPKGSSVVMYATGELRHAQYFVAPEWTGGIYASPTIAGSRPGAMIAGCWATMVYMGRDRYRDAFARILAAATAITEGVRAIPDLQLCGEPELSVVCFGVKPGSRMSVYSVADELSARGWNLNLLQNPACLHICVTFANCGKADEFVADVKAAVEAVKAAPAGKYSEGAGAMYGMAASIPDKSLVSDVAKSFLDALYQTTPPAAAGATAGAGAGGR